MSQIRKVDKAGFRTIEVFAATAWTANDVKTLRPKWSNTKCEEWFARNEKYVHARLIELGWEVIEALLPPK